MKNHARIFIVITLSLYLVSLKSIAFADDCDAVLSHGIFNQTIVTSDLKISRALNEYIYDTEYTTHQEAINDGFGIGTIIYGVPLKIDGTFDKQQRDEWKRTNIKYKNDKVDITEKRATLNRYASKDVLDAWTSCIDHTRGLTGLRAWIEEQSPEDLLLRVVWNPMQGDNGDSPIVGTSYIANGFRAQDNSSNAFDAGMQLARGDNNVSIKRDRNKPTTIVIHTINRGDVSASRRANIKPPIIADFSADRTTINRGETALMQWRTEGAEEVVIDQVGSVEKTWQRNVSPPATTTYTITARNGGGDSSKPLTITVIQPPPRLLSANVIFNTTDDDKNKETGVGMALYRDDRAQVGGEPLGHNDRFPDWSTNAISFRDINSAAGTKDRLQHGLLYIGCDAGNKDSWHFNMTMQLNFDDGTQLSHSWTGCNLGTNPGSGGYPW
ncbi:MAG: hypothetical protein LUO89_09905 [Methanothrix sp.]|nr:hypothetical protein [Methanothrix sp.]